MLNLLKNIFKTPSKHLEDGVMQFCKAEYGDDWQYAYVCYQKDGRFPSSVSIRS